MSINKWQDWSSLWLLCFSLTRNAADFCGRLTRRPVWKIYCIGRGAHLGDHTDVIMSSNKTSLVRSFQAWWFPSWANWLRLLFPSLQGYPEVIVLIFSFNCIISFYKTFTNWIDDVPFKTKSLFYNLFSFPWPPANSFDFLLNPFGKTSVFSMLSLVDRLM